MNEVFPFLYKREKYCARNYKRRNLCIRFLFYDLINLKDEAQELWLNRKNIDWKKEKNKIN